ncbi:aminoglycoside phosphotransferase [Thiomicrospira sp. XS5]|uniref:aminoglycoside phosphotransferase family protein n=1 Tax=Thiomicrospira sp. XS5 TaxID=1775636 RepID=UPI000748A0CB|nr:phosphotransferase [Thiomicrospira sp. XS5]KUJ75867.1 aminoglycoside phosphotransferase [Thiomicrospira sp. XS5]
MSQRFQQLQDWLSQCPSLREADVSIPVAASSDASFRRYYRINVRHYNAADSTRIIMDAPPEHEDCEPFVRIAGQLEQMGLTVPGVLEQDLEQGFLLLKDLGNETYLNRLLANESEAAAEVLYTDALNALVTLQTKGQQQAETLPGYDAALLNTEMALFTDWLLEMHLDVSLSATERQAWQNVTSALAQSALNQPQTYVHRDYHSRNLMVLDTGNPGILDFQDAVKGPLTYDAVSLLRDCYITWPAEQVTEWQRQYFLSLAQARLLAKDEWKGFVKAMDLMGIQRHLKASGIFARLYHRDGKDGYLNDVPTTVQYLYDMAPQYAETRALVDLLETKVLPALSKQSQVV